MSEEFDPKLRTREAELKEELSEGGFSTFNVPDEPPLNLATLMESFPEMETVLIKFRTLPIKIQTDIYEDIKNQRREEVSPKEILERFRVLVAKGGELNNMTAKDSDKTHKPKPLNPKDEEEMRELERSIRENVEEMVKEAERLIERDKRLEKKGLDKLVFALETTF